MFEALTYYSNWAVSGRTEFNGWTFLMGPPGGTEKFRKDGFIFTWNIDHSTVIAGTAAPGTPMGNPEGFFVFHTHPRNAYKLIQRCAYLYPMWIVSNDPKPLAMALDIPYVFKKSTRCVVHLTWDGRTLRAGQQRKLHERNTWLKLLGRMPRTRLWHRPLLHV